MEQNTLRKQRELTDRLNRYRNEYYNYNNPSVSDEVYDCLLYTSPSPRARSVSRMPSSA